MSYPDTNASLITPGTINMDSIINHNIGIDLTCDYDQILIGRIELIKMSETIEDLQKQVKDLQERVTALEYAPPGTGGIKYESAKNDFESRI